MTKIIDEQLEVDPGLVIRRKLGSDWVTLTDKFYEKIDVIRREMGLDDEATGRALRHYFDLEDGWYDWVEDEDS